MVILKQVQINYFQNIYISMVEYFYKCNCCGKEWKKVDLYGDEFTTEYDFILGFKQMLNK